MRQTLATIAFLLAAVAATAQNPASQPAIKIALAIDGEAASCDDLKVELRVGKSTVPVEQIDHGFVVPRIFAKLQMSKRSRIRNNISASIQCGKYAFHFDRIYPAQVGSGTWALGIGYPPFWVERERHVGALGNGTWISFISFDTDRCEPCLESWTSHTDPPNEAVEEFRRKRANAWGAEAASAAFALAVFKVDYATNRDYLAGILKECLSSQSGHKLKGICDDDSVLLFLESLYWRGDTGLLDQLLQAADSKSDAIGGVETFYEDLLAYRSAEALGGMQSLSDAKQQAVCKQAAEHLGRGSLNFRTVVANLDRANNKLARQCLESIEGNAR